MIPTAPARARWRPIFSLFLESRASIAEGGPRCFTDVSRKQVDPKTTVAYRATIYTDCWALR